MVELRSLAAGLCEPNADKSMKMRRQAIDLRPSDFPNEQRQQVHRTS